MSWRKNEIYGFLVESLVSLRERLNEGFSEDCCKNYNVLAKKLDGTARWVLTIS